MKSFSRFLKRCSDAGSYKCMYLSLAAACLAVSLTLYISSARKQEEAVASSVAPQVLRFHVLANSDSNEDQKLKFGVRDLLLEEIAGAFLPMRRERSRPHRRPGSSPTYSSTGMSLKRWPSPFWKSRGNRTRYRYVWKAPTFRPASTETSSFPAGSMMPCA